MTPARLAEAERNQTAVAKKVLEAVPISEPWPHGKIFGEIKRLGHSVDMRTLGGCLNSLIQAGLVRESKEGFIRITARVPTPVSHLFPPKPPELDKMPPAPIHPITPAPNPIGLKKVPIVTRMELLAKCMREWADALDELALDVVAELDETSASAEKLRQFKQLFKDL